MQLTGLTRDGLFLIEKGRDDKARYEPAVHGERGPAVAEHCHGERRSSSWRRTGMIAPAIQARNFTFTSVSDAV